MTNALCDTHCHLDAYSDPMAVLREATKADVAVVAVTGDPGAYRLLRTRLGRRPNVEVALGLHPLNVASRPADLARLLRLLPTATWIGEVGLDFSPAGKPTRRDQARVFNALLSEAQVRSRVMTVHSRGAATEVVASLVDAGAHAVLHWFTGPETVAERAVSGGLWFSANPAMVASAKGRRLIADIVPPQRWLLETDGPYVRVGARPARPSDVMKLTEGIARAWNLSTEEAAGIIRSNLRRLRASAAGPSGEALSSTTEPT